MRGGISRMAMGAALLIASVADARVTAEDPELPIKFTNIVPDICFQVARGRVLTAKDAAGLLLQPLAARPAVLRNMYQNVPTWFRAAAKPDNIFVGVGDAPGRCHVVLADTQDTRRAYGSLTSILKATGFKGFPLSKSQAMDVYVSRTSGGNMLVLVKGLTDATDGAGPQVSVDVAEASDADLRAILGR